MTHPYTVEVERITFEKYEVWAHDENEAESLVLETIQDSSEDAVSAITETLEVLRSYSSLDPEHDSPEIV